MKTNYTADVLPIGKTKGATADLLIHIPQAEIPHIIERLAQQIGNERDALIRFHDVKMHVAK